MLTERIKKWIGQAFISWLNERLDTTHEPATDFQGLKAGEIRTGDLVLVASRARVSYIGVWSVATAVSRAKGGELLARYAL